MMPEPGRTPDGSIRPAGRKVPRLKRYALNLGVVLSASILVLACAEGLVRLLRPEPWYVRVGAVQDLSALDRYTIGHFKGYLRAPLPEAPAREGTCRILFLGDSFTYGLGVEERDGFVSRVTSRLNEEEPVAGIRSYESFNGGIPASLTRQWVRLFREAVDRFQPDLVVTVFFIRDGTPGIASIELVDEVRKGMQALMEKSALFRYSHLYRLLRESRAQQAFSRNYLRVMSEAYLGNPGETAEWRQAQSNLLWLSEQSRQRGIDFSIAVFPMLFELTDKHPLAAAMAEVERFAADAKIPCISLLPLFRGQNAPSLWVSPLDQHPNPRGHLIAEEGIYDLVVDRLRAHYSGTASAE